MKKSIKIVAAVVMCSLIACVPARKLEELQVKYDNLQGSYDGLKTLKEFNDTTLADLKADYDALQHQYEATVMECDQQKADFEKIQNSYKILGENYKSLINSNETTKKDLRYELQQLDKQLDEKKSELYAK